MSLVALERFSVGRVVAEVDFLGAPEAFDLCFVHFPNGSIFDGKHYVAVGGRREDRGEDGFRCCHVYIYVRFVSIPVKRQTVIAV